MMSVYRCPTKKSLKEKVGKPAVEVLQETSVFGPELRDGRHAVVGPSPTVRKWYAMVEVRGGIIARVA